MADPRKENPTKVAVQAEIPVKMPVTDRNYSPKEISDGHLTSTMLFERNISKFLENILPASTKNSKKEFTIEGGNLIIERKNVDPKNPYFVVTVNFLGADKKPEITQNYTINKSGGLIWGEEIDRSKDSADESESKLTQNSLKIILDQLPGFSKLSNK